MDLLTPENKHAFTFKKISDSKNILLLDDIFQEIAKAAAEGKYSIDIKKDLSESQESILKSLDFYVSEYGKDADQYKDGYRTYIDWEDAEDPDEDE